MADFSFLDKEITEAVGTAKQTLDNATKSRAEVIGKGLSQQGIRGPEIQATVEAILGDPQYQELEQKAAAATGAANNSRDERSREQLTTKVGQVQMAKENRMREIVAGKLGDSREAAEIGDAISDALVQTAPKAAQQARPRNRESFER